MSWMNRQNDNSLQDAGNVTYPGQPPPPTTQQQQLFTGFHQDPNVKQAQQTTSDQYNWQQQSQQNYNQQQNFQQYQGNQQYYNYNQPDTALQSYQQTQYNQQPLYSQQPPGNQQQNFNYVNNPNQKWEENWDWNWDESKQQNTQPQQAILTNNNQNNLTNKSIIEESFSGNDSWNWTVDDRNDALQTSAKSEIRISEKSSEVSNETNENTENNRQVLLSTEMEELALGNELRENHVSKLLNRVKHETLTPQWSIESQMSQDSSDISQNEHLAHSELHVSNEINSSHPVHQSPFKSVQMSPIDTNQIEIREPPQDNRMNIEKLASDIRRVSLSSDQSRRSMDLGPGQSGSNSQTVAAVPSTLDLFSAADANKSFVPKEFDLEKLSSPKVVRSNDLHSQSPMINQQSTSMNRVNKQPIGQTYQMANLETMPENSERPDQLLNYTNMPQIPPQNLEVTPTNDRNEYLQSDDLSNGEYENPDYNQPMHRMVVGRNEHFVRDNNLNSDEPPPGLSRMVPGQQRDDSFYVQSDDSYRSRHIDGQNNENDNMPAYSSHQFRQVQGQPVADYSQPSRRPIGLDRMVPGESSSSDFTPQPYAPSSNFGTAEQRVVTGVDHDYIPPPTSENLADVREKNLDGSDYSEILNKPRNVSMPDTIKTHDQIQPPSMDCSGVRESQMEGENLQDLSNVSSTDLSFSRDLRTDGAGVTTPDDDPKKILSDSTEHGTSRKKIPTKNSSCEESERDRIFKLSPRREKDRRRSLEEERRHKHGKERTSERDSGRKSVKERDDRKSKDYRSDRRKHDSYYRDDRRYRDDRDSKYRSRDGRYETEDTDYYSDRERRYREGSYSSASKPPIPEDRDKRRDERSRDKRRGYATIEKERKYDLDSDSSRRKDRYYDDRDKKYYSLRREKDSRRKGHYSPSRPDSRDPDPIEDERNEADTRRGRSDRRPRRGHDYDYYTRYGDYQDPYLLQRQHQQTYQYYEHLRLSNPVAYMEVYKKVMAGEPLPPPPPGTFMMSSNEPGRAPSGFDNNVYTSSSMYDRVINERGSVHSGRSSANGLTANNTYYNNSLDQDSYSGVFRPINPPRQSYHRRTGSYNTELSGSRDLNTDVSLPLEESTVRSDRMTPFKFSTAHVKGNISTNNLIMIHPSYPVDGNPATVEIVSINDLLVNDNVRNELSAYPGPLVKDVTHKKSVIDFCESKIRHVLELHASSRSAHMSNQFIANDLSGYILLWEFLVLMLRQNGMVVGTDISELLIMNKREFEIKSSKHPIHSSSRRNSCLSSNTSRSDLPDDEFVVLGDKTATDNGGRIEEDANDQPAGEHSKLVTKRHHAKRVDEKVALDKFREYLLLGNRKDALDWAISCGLWGHAMQLAGSLERRARLMVSAKFLSALPPSDPLHTLYAAAAARAPPAVTCVSDEKFGDWRPHLAMLLSNPSAKMEQDKKTIITLGDTLSARGLIYSAQVCYICAGVPLSRHRLAPLQPSNIQADQAPRLTLLTAVPQPNTLTELATNEAIMASEIYEYARSLNHPDYVIPDLQVYKYLLCVRLIDCGMYERALAYTDTISRTLIQTPHMYSHTFMRIVTDLADRLKYFDPSMNEEGSVADEDLGDAEGATSSPRPQQWATNLKNIIDKMEHNIAENNISSVQATVNTTQQQSNHTWTQYNEQSQGPPPPPPLYQTGHDAEQYNDNLPTEYPTPYTEQETSQPTQQPMMFNPMAMSQQYNEYPQQYPQEHQTAHIEDNTDGYNGGGDQVNWGTNYDYSEEGADGTYDAGFSKQQISMPNSADKKPSIFDDYNDDNIAKSDANKNENQHGKNQHKQGNIDDSKQHGGSGWFGGIFNKLSLKPKNQMILPDDKNPTIVWDDDKKRWKNLESEGDDHNEHSLLPPPKNPTNNNTNINPSVQPTSMPPMSSSGNLFKMQKNRQIKKSYVDVFNPGNKTSGQGLAAAIPDNRPTQASTPNYFVSEHQQANVKSPMMYDPSQY